MNSFAREAPINVEPAAVIFQDTQQVTTSTQDWLQCIMSDVRWMCMLSKDIASKSRQYYPIPYHFRFFNFHITTRQAADITLILIRIQNKSSATYFTNRMFLLQSTLWSDQSSCHSYHRGPISKGHMQSVQGYNPWDIWMRHSLAIALLTSSIYLEKWLTPI